MGLIKISKPKTALWYAVGMWVIGFVWGLVVFTVPLLKAVPTLPHVSKFPAVSAPLMVAYTGLLILLTKRYLVGTENGVREAVGLGIILVLGTIVLDSLVYVILFNGTDYFAYASIWVAYALFVFIPWLTAKRIEKKETDPSPGMEVVES